MSSTVSQGLQSCLEPRLIEQRILRLKLAPPKSSFPSGSLAPSLRPSCFPDSPRAEPKAAIPHEDENKPSIPAIAIATKGNNNNDCNTKSSQNADMGGWSFLQSLGNKAKESSNEKDKVYVHPLVKRSSSMLSEKSLQMCTESLGSETGTDVSENIDDISLLSLETGVCNNPSKPRENSMTKRMHHSSSSEFPPPLTSISSSSGVQVRSHREGGRLILQAVTLPSPRTYFQAQRSEGRLRLCLLEDVVSPICNNEEEEENEEEKEDYSEDVVDEEDATGEDEEEVGGGEEEEGEDEMMEDFWAEDKEEESLSGGDEIGKEKLPRPISCKEGGRGQKGLLNWEPCWVAT